MKNYYNLKVPAGTYSSNNIFILILEIIKHRLWHLFKNGKWTD